MSARPSNCRVVETPCQFYNDVNWSSDPQELQFEIEFVPIGDPGNLPDERQDDDPRVPKGTVDYSYRMGKFEISEQMVNKANELGGLGITLDNRGPDKPATSVSWVEAAKFVNWLNESAGHTPAYKFDLVPQADGSLLDQFVLWEPADAGYDPANQFRNGLARYALPSANEWFKAAYYDPADGTYEFYPTGGDSAPLSVASGTLPNTAVYRQFTGGPADIMQAGGLSPYGTMAQGGNVTEWEESHVLLVNDDPLGPRGVRGGQWRNSAFRLESTTRSVFALDEEFNVLGFRVVSVPEPNTIVLLLIGLLVLAVRRPKLVTQ